MLPEGGRQTERVAETVARQSYGKLVAFLAHRTRDLTAAEDALAEAFARALVVWPVRGVPRNPEAWLMTVARRKAIDAGRRQRVNTEAAAELLLLADQLATAADENPEIPDRRLALIFACAHPALDPSVRAPLILQTILGFSAEAIGSAFLVAPTAMAQRLVRAKTRIRQAGVPFRVPERAELGERLDAVLDAIYAAYAEGWSDPAGTETRRRDLAEDAIWLAQLVTALLPDEPEALGLLAMVLFAEARRSARRDAAGEYVPLAEQDTTLWDVRMIEAAETALHRAAAMTRPGRYQLEAAIQSAHVVRRLTGSADWGAIERLYDGLLALTGSPVVAINRAVAAAETSGPAAGLAALDVVADDRRLAEYQPYWAARADLLNRAGQRDAARSAYRIAIGLEADPAVRRYLQRREASVSGC
jgi:RNA polymerase sigma-70 factor (ECF subfamily)